MINLQIKTWKIVLHLNSLIFVLESETNGFEMCRGNRKRDVTTMVTYSHATTPLGQSERAYYLSYFIKLNSTRYGVYHLFYNITLQKLEQQKSFRVHTTMLSSMCHAMPFLARALKKNIFFDVDVVVKNKSKCGLSWSVLLPTTSMCHYSFPKHFLRIVSAY